MHADITHHRLTDVNASMGRIGSAGISAVRQRVDDRCMVHAIDHRTSANAHAVDPANIKAAGNGIADRWDVLADLTDAWVGCVRKGSWPIRIHPAVDPGFASARGPITENADHMARAIEDNLLAGSARVRRGRRRDRKEKRSKTDPQKPADGKCSCHQLF